MFSFLLQLIHLGVRRPFEFLPQRPRRRANGADVAIRIHFVVVSPQTFGVEIEVDQHLSDVLLVAERRTFIKFWGGNHPLLAGGGSPSPFGGKI